MVKFEREIPGSGIKISFTRQEVEIIQSVVLWPYRNFLCDEFSVFHYKQKHCTFKEPTWSGRVVLKTLHAIKLKAMLLSKPLLNKTTTTGRGVVAEFAINSESLDYYKDWKAL